MDVETTETTGDFDEGATYKGTVKSFRPNQFVTITPTDDLSAVGVKNNKVEASASDIQTNESPVYLQKEQEVEFRLRKDEYGVFAFFVSGANGSPVSNTEVPEPKQQELERTPLNGGQTYAGTVTVFQWGAGFGFVTLTEDSGFEMPADEFPGKDKFEKSKKLWFHRSDIVSTDPAVGVDKDQEVQFTIYTDSKGIGAAEVAQRGGAAISGARNNLRRKPKQKKKKRTADQAGFNMQGMGGQPIQVVMMNGVPYMMVPVQGGGGGPSKKKRKSSGYKPREGDWACPECSFNNWNRREVCRDCEKGKRPDDIEVLPPQEREMQDGDWTCKCSFVNFARRDRCRDCQEAKPGGEDATSGMDVEAEATTAL